MSYPIKKRLKLYGFDISIENPKGSIRRWYDPHGKESGSTKILWDYGYIRKTRGTDGDHVDVYIGPDTEADHVFIVDQMKKPPGAIVKDGKSWTQFDEQKVMLAFKDAASAKAAYMKQYDDPRFFGSMKEMSVDEFRDKVLDKSNHGKKIAYAASALGGGAGGAVAGLLSTVGRGGAGPSPAVRATIGAALGAALGAGAEYRDRKKKTANGDMLEYFQKHPEKAKAYMERKKRSSLLATVNLVRMAEGDPIYLPKTAHADVLGSEDPQITTLPAVTSYSQAAMSKQEKKDGDRQVKEAAGDRAGRLADRVDDVGIGVLAAPYVADVAGHAMQRIPKLRGAGAALSKGFGTESAFGKSHGREIAGLALVAPGVTHTIAKGVDKALPQKKAAVATYDQLKNWEKVAQQLFPDYEYRTEAEKTAVLQTIGRMAGGLVRAGSKAVQEGAALVKGPGLKDRVMAGFHSARLGRNVTPQAVQRGRSIAASRAAGDAAFGASRVIDPRGLTIAEAPAAKALAKKKPQAAAASRLAPAKSKWNPLSARNIALGAGATGLGLAAYGGYKGIQTGANMLQREHEFPLAAPAFAGAGRAF